MKDLEEVRKGLEPLRERMKVLEEKLAILQPISDDILLIREAVLDGLAFEQDENINKLGKEFSCGGGGHIVADVEVIDRSRNQAGERLVQWKKVFEDIYQIKYDEVKDEINKASPAIVDAYNMRANVLLCETWENEERREAGLNVKNNCDVIIQKWQCWLGNAKKGAEPDVEEEYRKAKNVYDSHYLQAFLSEVHSD